MASSSSKLVCFALALAAATVLVAPCAAQNSPQDYLDPHNAVRSDVGVDPVSWDDTLAEYAQSYAAQRQGDCAFVHSGGSYGENLFCGSAGADWSASDAVGSWVDEKQYYDHDSNSCSAPEGKSCLKYFPVVTMTPRYNQKSMAFSSWKLACIGLAFAAALVAPCAAQNSAQNSAQDFVNLHNAAREAVGLGQVHWDDNVAAYAQSYAAQRQGDCTLMHSTNRPYGENIYMGPAGKAWSAADAVGLWVEEKQYYDHATNSCSAPVDKSCGHYTQIVWRDSTAIGCARVDCSNGGVFIICSYNPPGNVIGQSPY
ncbi:hypothetical protein EJB05_14426, partial [Eragrostis curvula]